MTDKNTPKPVALNDLSFPVKWADLPMAAPFVFDFHLTDLTLQLAAKQMDVLEVSKCRLFGRLQPDGKHDWVLEAQLGATVTQACVVTLNPIKTRIDQKLRRRFLADLPEPEPEAVVEVEPDDEIEQLGRDTDLVAITLEAILLALPDYPRTPGVSLGEAVFTEPGKPALTDADAHPFAALKALKDKS